MGSIADSRSRRQKSLAAAEAALLKSIEYGASIVKLMAANATESKTLDITTLSMEAQVAVFAANLREDISGIADLAGCQSLDTLPEGEAEAQIDDGVLGGEKDSKKGGDLFADLMCVREKLIEFADKSGPHLKSMDGPGTREYSLGEGVGLSIDVEDLGLMTGLDSRNNAHSYDCGRGNAQTDEGELPTDDEGNDKRCQECRQPLERETELLSDTSLD